jgi:hypothetical protein
MATTTETPAVADLVAPAFVRGRLIADDLVEFGGRGGDIRFRAPSSTALAGALPLADPTSLADLYKLSFDDIVDFLVEVGSRLDLASNPHLQQALDVSYHTAPVTAPPLVMQYETMNKMFAASTIRDMVELNIGLEYLEGWVKRSTHDGRSYEVRAFGSRAVHIVAGNSPNLSALSIIRNAVTRSDAIIKSPSNDPMTALAIARTMAEVDPEHPVTKHLSVAYWRGGDQEFESRLYQPRNVEKIVAWGGFAGLKNITRYLQPGIELIALDPKTSISVIGRDAFASEAEEAEASIRLAADVGAMNQKGCVCSRIAFVETGVDEAGLKRANAFGERVYRDLFALPEHFSTKPKRYSRELKAHVDAIRLSEDWYHVVGGEEDEGAVIVSQLPEQVDFARLLDDRTVNVVPVYSVDDVLKAIDAYTQTIGLYPEALKDRLKDVLPLYGAQRIVSLGFAIKGFSHAAPQDAIEPLRRMCKWVVNEAPHDDHRIWKGAKLR